VTVSDVGLAGTLAEVASARRLLVGSDFDGTLSELVADPDDARPAEGALEALRRLAECPGVTVLVLSGRSLRELSVLLHGVDGVRLVGSHGAERDDDAAFLTEEQEQLRARLVLELARAAAPVPGARLERKPAGAAVHVRRAARDDAARLLGALRSGPASWPGVRATEGKEVLELSVVDVDKGRAFVRFRDELDADAAVFVGDDVTDEHVFAALGPRDLAVKVGPGPTVAPHRVRGTDDVVALLNALADARVG
jgi:trehalose 6-phosphate phosphatase